MSASLALLDVQGNLHEDVLYSITEGSLADHCVNVVMYVGFSGVLVKLVGDGDRLAEIIAASELSRVGGEMLADIDDAIAPSGYLIGVLLFLCAHLIPFFLRRRIVHAEFDRIVDSGARPVCNAERIVYILADEVGEFVKVFAEKKVFYAS